MEVYVDETKLTLHGLQQYYVKLKDAEKNRKLFQILDDLEFNQVCKKIYFLISPNFNVYRCPEYFTRSLESLVYIDLNINYLRVLKLFGNYNLETFDYCFLICLYYINTK